MTRVLIADDQEDVRTGFRYILDAQPDIEVVGEAADGVAAVDLARVLRPDVALVDVRMPRMDGIEVTRRIAASVRVVVVTTFDLDEYVHAALRHGACGFLVKRAGPGLLVEAVRAAVVGDALISPSVTVRLLRSLGRGEPGEPVESLTEREGEVARLVALGRTNAEIGAELFVSTGTAKTHVANIGRKLRARNRVEIAAWVWQRGW